MLIRPMLMRGPTGPAPISPWNPADTPADITLSNGNATATKNAAGGTFRTLRGLTSKSTGQWYFEGKFVTIGASSGVFIGLADSGLGQTQKAGVTSTSISLRSDGFVIVGNASKASYGDIAAGSIIGLLYDGGAATVAFYKNNTLLGTPVAFSPGAPMFQCSTLIDVNDVIQLTNMYSPPSGSSGWN